MNFKAEDLILAPGRITLDFTSLPIFSHSYFKNKKSQKILNASNAKQEMISKPFIYLLLTFPLRFCRLSFFFPLAIFVVESFALSLM